MRYDVVERDGPQATETPAEYPFEFVMPVFEFTLSQNSVDTVDENNTQTTDLETFMSCLPASNDDSMSKFYTSYGYLPPLPSQEDEHLPLGIWVDFDDVDFGTLFI